jgi:hypothetical protein
MISEQWSGLHTKSEITRAKKKKKKWNYILSAPLGRSAITSPIISCWLIAVHAYLESRGVVNLC